MGTTFFQGFWVSLPADGDLDAACADMAGMRAQKVLAYVEHFSRDDIARFVEACHTFGMEFHAWTVNNMVGKGYSCDFVEGHRAWLAVNRKGHNGLDFPLWGRQIWWCPSNREYLDHYMNRWNGLLAGTGADGLHLDFIRYPDIWDYVDGRAVERAETPEYSFCYCRECRRRFHEGMGRDPLDVPLEPGDELYREWTRWRMNVISESVRGIREGIDGHLKLSAAVFPTPAIARAVVLQDWPGFAERLDFVCAMIYAQKQWGRPISWVKVATEEGLREIGARCRYYAGFGYPIAQQTPDELRDGMLAAAEGGADGVVIFSYAGLTPEQKAAIISVNEEIASRQ